MKLLNLYNRLVIHVKMTLYPLLVTLIEYFMSFACTWCVTDQFISQTIVWSSPYAVFVGVSEMVEYIITIHFTTILDFIDRMYSYIRCSNVERIPDIFWLFSFRHISHISYPDVNKYI